jgi:hypothetical protein
MYFKDLPSQSGVGVYTYDSSYVEGIGRRIKDRGQPLIPSQRKLKPKERLGAWLKL